MFRRLSLALVAAALAAALPCAAAAQDATLGVSYASPGVNPTGTVNLVFGVYTSETANQPMSNGAFTYTVPAGLTATGVTDSIYCPATVSLTGNVLTVSGMTQTPSFICEITVSLRADTLGVYPLAPTTLSYSTPAGAILFRRPARR